MTPLNALYRQATSNPNAVALVERQKTWTYRLLADEAARLAQGLRSRGVQPGDRVALHMANVVELVLAYYACFHIGAIAVPLGTRLKSAELRALLGRLQPSLYIGQAHFHPRMEAVDEHILSREARYVVDGPAKEDHSQPLQSLLGGEDPLPTSPSDADPAVLLCTSGTTGDPKFVAHTPATLAAMTDSWAHVGLSSVQTSVSAVPLVHAAGLYALLVCIRYGVPMILVESFDPDRVLDAIATHRATWLLGHPYMFVDMLRRQSECVRRIHTLKLCLAGGDVCPPHLHQEFARKFGVVLRSMWGATEVVGSLLPGLTPGPVSRIAPGAQIQLVDEQGARVPKGQVGELLIRGPNVTPGYWEGPGRLVSATQDGWFRTGDLMRQGEVNDLWFVARRKDLIIRGGSNISPIEVERVLMSHPSVSDAAVVGVPDDTLGQRVGALVRLIPDASDADVATIRANVQAQLADYKVPEHVHVVAEIPRNASGKIDRRAALSVLCAHVRLH